MELFGTSIKRVVRALGNVVEEYKDVGRGYVIKLRDPLVRELYLTQVPVGFSFDVKTIMSTAITLVPKEGMDEGGKRLYRLMKGMECVLEYRGFLPRRPVFVSRPELSSLRSMVSGLEVSAALADRLNEDRELMSLVRSLKPSDIRVLLKSYELPTFMPGDRVGMLMTEADYYGDPGELTWIITMSVMLPATVFYGRNVRKSLEILRRIARHIDETFKRVSSGSESGEGR